MTLRRGPLPDLAPTQPDVAGHINHKSPGSDLADADDDVSTLSDALGTEGVVQEGRRQADVIHGVEVDDRSSWAGVPTAQSANANSKSFSSAETAVTSAIRDD